MSKLTDYAIVLMAHLAADPERVQSAHDVSLGSGLKPPTVAKLLRILAREGLLVSHRGARGGFSLARSAEEISIGEIIRALEGPIALTECGVTSGCAHEGTCGVRSPWQKINLAVRDALESIRLADMVSPTFPFLFTAGVAGAGGRSSTGLRGS